MTEQIKRVRVVEWNSLRRQVAKLSADIQYLKHDIGDMEHMIHVLQQTLLVPGGKTLGK